MGTAYKFRAHVFSEAELAEYKNRVITEFMIEEDSDKDEILEALNRLP